MTSNSELEPQDSKKENRSTLVQVEFQLTIFKLVFGFLLIYCWFIYAIDWTVTQVQQPTLLNELKRPSVWHLNSHFFIPYYGLWHGRRHDRGTEGNSPPLLTKVIFVNRLKPMRKYLGYGGVIFEFQPEFVTSGFQRRI